MKQKASVCRKYFMKKKYFNKADSNSNLVDVDHGDLLNFYNISTIFIIFLP